LPGLRLRVLKAGFFLGVSGLLLGTVLAPAQSIDKPYRKWTLDEAVEVLTHSPWARQETFTRVVGGIGSGVLGEKEILNTFFVRLLSARPVREAYARIRQIQAGYDGLSNEERRRLDASLLSVLKLDTSRWIVVTVSFRTNDESTEIAVRQFFETQTTESMRSRAHLSTDRFTQIELAAYFAPDDEAVGAKFVFPRQVGGEAAVDKNDQNVIFELAVPGLEHELRVTFPVPKMVVKGELAL